MSQTHLEALMPELLAIDDNDVDAPHLPMAVALQEAHDLALLLDTGDVAPQLQTVGITLATIAKLPALISAAREAQSRWTVARDRTKDDAQRTRELEGAALRADLLASCRWNLRHNRTAQATLTAIAAGDGTADLIQDLNDLAELINKHQPAFDADHTFDAPSRAEAARGAASAIATGLSSERNDIDQRSAKRLRDRAFTLLDDHVSLFREAGRYRFRGNSDMTARLVSPYLRRRRRRTAAKAAAAKEAATNALATAEAARPTAVAPADAHIER